MIGVSRQWRPQPNHPPIISPGLTRCPMMNLTVPHHVSPQHWNVVSEIIIFRTFFFLTKKKHIKLTLLSHINRISQVVFTTSHVIVSHFWWIVGWSYHIKSTENRQSHIKIWYSQPCFCFFFGRFPRQISQKIRQISRTSPANRISRLWPLYTIIIIILRSVVLYIYTVYILYIIIIIHLPGFFGGSTESQERLYVFTSLDSMGCNLITIQDLEWLDRCGTVVVTVM